jgi:outer membrane receptor protein involved in Fe transport
MDGASAIYGSDAVGGVVNIIMKDHFEGFESGARFGTVTNGGMRQFQAYQNAGKNWGTGNVLLSYEYYEQKPLLARQRRFAMSADSRPLGGTDHRNIYSLPGNILGYNPATRSFGATYAIPAGQNGTALQPGDFIAGQANRGDPQEAPISSRGRHGTVFTHRSDRICRAACMPRLKAVSRTAISRL